MKMNMFPIQRSLLTTIVLIFQACGGGSGGNSVTNPSTTTSDPIPVLHSSFENKNAAVPVALTQLPRLSSLPGFATSLALLTGTVDSVPASLAVADFQRNGSYSAFVIASNGIDQARAFFVGYSANGVWSELSELFKTTLDWGACVRPEQSAVADLNGDGRPDIYVACSGDYGVGAHSDPQYVYLSQPDGKYVKSTTLTIATPNVTMDSNSVAIADINNDGCKDVITTDNGNLQILMATSCNGTYALSGPAANAGRKPVTGGALLPTTIRSVFLVPRRDPLRYDLLVGGNGNQGFPMKWYRNNNGTGYFDTTDQLQYRTYALTYGDSNNRYDYLESDAGYIYVRNGSTQDLVGLFKIPLPNDGSSTSIVSLIPPPPHTRMDWPAAMRIVGTKIRVYDAGCDFTVVLNNQSRCGRQYDLGDFPALP